MEDFSFRSFFEEAQFEITVEEVGNLFENEILGNFTPDSKKYRVTFHAPKNMRAWKKGDFEQDIVYIISDSPHTAKRVAQDWIGRRLDPREDQARPKRVPKNNYLRTTEKRHFDMRSRVVGSWQQVVEMLGFAAERRQNAVDFIDEPELEILVDALSGRSKRRLLDGLSETERKGLRQLLQGTKKNPAQWDGHHGKRSAALAKELTVKLWPRRGEAGGDQFSAPAATPATGDTYRNNVYRRKLTKRDVNAIMARVNTYGDVIREANRLGITKGMLDGIVASRYEAADKVWSEKRLIFADLYKQLHIPSTHDVFGDDHVSKYWQKRNFNWEAYATEVLPTFGLETIRNNPQGEESDYTANAEYTDWAVNWLWELYRAGPPRREGTQSQRYKDALDEMLNGHMEDKKLGRQPQVRQPADEEIPW